MTKTTGRVTGVNGNMVSVRVEGAVSMNEVAYIHLNEKRLKSEVIRIRGDIAQTQVYEITKGIKIGDAVEFSGELLSVELGPGLLGQIYDGLQNPLPLVAAKTGNFLEPGVYLEPLPRDRKWPFTPSVKVGDKLERGDAIGTVPEESFTHRIMAFAFGEPSVFIETNIRSVYLYHFFPGEEAVADKLLEPLIAKSLDRKDPRSWYYGLMLKPALSRGELQCIGATTLDEYRKYFEKDAALERRFQPLVVEEPSPEQALAILAGIKSRYEEFHRVSYSDQAVEASVELSRRYIAGRFLPDKAIDLLDEAGAYKKVGSPARPPELLQIEEEIRRLNEEKLALVSTQNYEKAAETRDRVRHLKSRLEALKSEWEAQGNSAVVMIDGSILNLVLPLSSL